MSEREDFYENGVREFIRDKDARILICGGGARDKSVFEKLGFHDVTISNLDARITGNEFAPFSWKYEDAESLSFSADSFDYVVIHAAIHHASSPHRVLTEMYRVAQKGVLAFESRDSLVVRLLERCGVVETYEHTAVYRNGCSFGGVNNTEIPNYVYRWTEREVEKTIQSYAPYAKHKIIYRYGTAFPASPKHEKRGTLKIALLRFARPFFFVIARLFPRQQNLFSFYIEKHSVKESLFPWLILNQQEGRIRFCRKWGDEKYKGNTAGE